MQPATQPSMQSALGSQLYSGQASMPGGVGGGVGVCHADAGRDLSPLVDAEGPPCAT